MNVLVTGGGGFVGGAVVRSLAARHAPRVHLGPPGVPLSCPVPGVPTMVADIADRATLLPFAAGVEVVVHLAGPAHVSESFHDPDRYFQTHVLGTVSMIDVCVRASIPRFVYVSSAEVYGRAAVSPVAETAACRPRSPYAAAKAAAEHVVTAAARAHGIDAIIIRPFSIYGPAMRPSAVLASVIRQACDGGPVRVFDLRPVRDYCFVDDVAAAIVAVSEAAAATEPRIYNVGTGAGVSVADLAKLTLEVMGVAAAIEEAAATDRPAVADIPDLVADTSAIRHDVHWSPRVELSEGIRRTVSWWTSTHAVPQ
jgi:UDP-glucose 4-epimerase